jgi:hypothetical protein
MCGSSTRECGFPKQKAIAHDTQGKLCGFIHYNVQYVVFIVMYITLKLQLDIKLWHITFFAIEMQADLLIYTMDKFQ